MLGRCETLERRVCSEEYVLLRKPVEENCTIKSEYCETFHRQQVFLSETVFCEQR